jgi:hypothetical protein
MKKLALIVALVVLSASIAFSQTQTVNINVGAVALLSTSGTATLTIGPAQATVGTDLFADVNSTGATTISMTHNGSLTAATAKLTANISANLAIGTAQLLVNVAALNGGTPDANVDISTVGAVEVQNSIPRGAGTANVSYTLSGVKASDGQFSGSRTVTYTITAD